MSALTNRLGIHFPLIQAGMGGVAGVELAAAVSCAGAGGVLGLYRARAPNVRDLVRETRGKTASPFGVNLIPELMDHDRIIEQIEATLEVGGPSIFFVFYGLPEMAAANLVTKAGNPMLIMVGSASAATQAHSMGADAVILQGTEAGGHLLGVQCLRELIAEVRVGGCSLPILGAGGIATGKQLREIEMLGASGCVCGTLFAATIESQAHPLYKSSLIDATGDDTVVTQLFDIGWRNRRHRVLRNVLTDLGERRLPIQFIAKTNASGHSYPVPRYSATVPTSQTFGRIEEMAMYCGESVSFVSEIMPARVRVEKFIAEYLDDSDAATPDGSATLARVDQAAI